MKTIIINIKLEVNIKITRNVCTMFTGTVVFVALLGSLNVLSFF